jgi:hypothetical protein
MICNAEKTDTADISPVERRLKMSLNSNDPYQAPFSSSSWEDAAGPHDPTVVPHTAYGPGNCENKP